MGFVITLILVGLVLVFAEILLIPGVGIAGVLGILSLGGSCYYAFAQMSTTAGVIVTSVNIVLIVALTVWVLRAKTWRKFTLNTNINSVADINNVLCISYILFIRMNRTVIHNGTEA